MRDRDEHEAWIFRPFVRPGNGKIRYHPQLPADSAARTLGFRPLRALIRPWSPAGLTKSGIWIDRHGDHPRVWAFLLAATAADMDLYGLKFGWLYHFKRFSTEELLEDIPKDPIYGDYRHPIHLIRLDQMPLCVMPAPCALPV